MQNTISQRGMRYQFDVIVIGSGIAGLTYILELLKLRPSTRVALITKTRLKESNSSYAQGGVAAAYQEDDIAKHIADTLAAGDGLCYQETVATILQQGPAAIEYLIEQGVCFDHDKNMQLLRGREAGHSERR